jgi:uncharacterized protein
MIDWGGLPHAAVVALAGSAFVAGFIDAIAGGGGLITVPAMALAGLDPVTAIATNKLQSSFGSGSAMLAFARAGLLRWRPVAGVVLAATIGSILGASVLTRAPLDWVRNALPLALLVIAAWFAVSPRLADAQGPARLSDASFAVLVAPLIGCYDGAFGPGTGSFFMLAFVGLRGLAAIEATGRTKAANFASNVAGLLTLASSGHVIWALGLAMGLGQFAGAQLGARAAMRFGARLVRPLLIAVSLLLAARLAWDRWH